MIDKSEMTTPIEVYLAAPRGFCAGVERAIETVKLSLDRYGKPVYVLHEIVHNKHVIAQLEESGAVFVENLQDIPPGEVCIFSAHGVSRAIEERARELGLQTVDATCPLVSSVHRMVEKYHVSGYDVIIIGHHGHPEVEGTAGRVTGRVHIVANEREATDVMVADVAKIAYVTQTTLCENDVVGILTILSRRFPDIKGPKSNICFATQNRQNAVKELAEKADLLFVVGSKNSSNSNRLKEVALQCGVEAHLIDDYRDLDPAWLIDKKKIGITAGASAPEELVEGVVGWMKEHGAETIVELKGIKERIHFRPSDLASQED
ncbi:4-hydroxy-3-methylbut-2-enyl diphosphate reductase [Desulfopila sp. IMCC35006]|uniref:4-hydroxy-3-methylbut-2-enyl diphosphate reductase n=1 Tax=Desulfopila sp. IMCC35006 TaxID=2569542 RepID=UPI001F10BB17|nr:4-hydroxy-3-methylbut-2-enyl diphosphate reductase [Desulfopila sp. IMCC35006]